MIRLQSRATGCVVHVDEATAAGLDPAEWAAPHAEPDDATEPAQAGDADQPEAPPAGKKAGRGSV